MTDRRRMLGFIGAAVVTLGLVGFLNLTAVPVTGQAAASLKTAWGEPDLQGIWEEVYNTPLQRAAQYGNREFFTDAERAEFDKRRPGRGPRQACRGRRDGRTSPAPTTQRSPRGGIRRARRRLWTRLTGDFGDDAEAQQGPSSARLPAVKPPTPARTRIAATPAPTGSMDALAEMGSDPALLQHRALESAHQRRGRQPGRPLHVGHLARCRRLPPNRAGAGRDHDVRRHRAGSGVAAQHRDERHPASAAVGSAMAWGFARPLGRQYPRDRRHEFLAENQLPGIA